MIALVRLNADVYSGLVSLQPRNLLPNRYLTAREQKEYFCIKAPHRRRAYLVGRWLGKQIAAGVVGASPGDIEILSRNSNNRSTRPLVAVADNFLTVPMSISHDRDSVFVVASNQSNCKIGCDLERVRELGSAFRNSWFTDSERSRFPMSSGITSSLIWSAKEAAYKALNDGEPFKPRRFEIQVSGCNSWRCNYNWENDTRSCTLQVFKIKQKIAVVAIQNP